MAHLCLCCFLPAVHVKTYLEAILSSVRIYGPSLSALRGIERQTTPSQ